MVEELNKTSRVQNSKIAFHQTLPPGYIRVPWNKEDLPLEIGNIKVDRIDVDYLSIIVTPFLAGGLACVMTENCLNVYEVDGWTISFLTNEKLAHYPVIELEANAQVFYATKDGLWMRTLPNIALPVLKFASGESSSVGIDFEYSMNF